MKAFIHQEGWNNFWGQHCLRNNYTAIFIDWLEEQWAQQPCKIVKPKCKGNGTDSCLARNSYHRETDLSLAAHQIKLHLTGPKQKWALNKITLWIMQSGHVLNIGQIATYYRVSCINKNTCCAWAAFSRIFLQMAGIRIVFFKLQLKSFSGKMTKYS